MQNDEFYMARAFELARLGRFTTTRTECGLRDRARWQHRG
ncbi:Uncharacterised protein [Serratia fonticola]|uniref:Uncharacterized protein n=1 Tax=Serratia fonticola TaxID=47917 RepID=A0A4U9U578_SERFO|nr:Uncharacterised protein [Serratia fonticola]